MPAVALGAAAVIREHQGVPVTGKSLPKADGEGKAECCWCDLNQSTSGLLSTHHIPPQVSHFWVFSGQDRLTSGLHANEAILHDVNAPNPMLAPVRRREVAAVPVTQVAVKVSQRGAQTPNDSRPAPEQHC